MISDTSTLNRSIYFGDVSGVTLIPRTCQNCIIIQPANDFRYALIAVKLRDKLTNYVLSMADDNGTLKLLNKRSSC